MAVLLMPKAGSLQVVTWENWSMTELTEFLRAQLDRVEDMARSGIAAESYLSDLGELLLREVEAKRRIVDLHGAQPHECVEWDDTMSPYTCTTYELDCPTLRALALPYADQPGYDEALTRERA
jgi:hypothetical protein